MAYYTYPIILILGMVSMVFFWGGDTFPYVAGMTLFRMMIPLLIVSIAIGTLLGLFFDFRTLKLK